MKEYDDAIGIHGENGLGPYADHIDWESVGHGLETEYQTIDLDDNGRFAVFSR